MFDLLDMGASGLQAQRTRLDTIAQNILNAETIQDAAGRNVPYRRRFVLFAPGQAGNPAKPGVHVREIQVDQNPFTKRHIPGHPLADVDGNVLFPNVDPIVEQVNALSATRAYEANVSLIETSKAMLQASLRLLA
ncbi:MAG TPA: flagellar basal body rod protein FlgC [Tepidisphaeraceae bacterium]|nr:flagellar basal body rod protein FlgC [Tepidisphaeraceae bacterium]